MGNSYYLGFSAFVQIAVAFCFGMLFLDRKSFFSKLQQYVFDGFRKNKVCQLVLKYAGVVTKRVKSNSFGHFFLIWRARINQFKDKFNAALNSERTCNYLAATGIVSALFSLTWLLIMPTYTICDEAFEGHYLTHCLSVAIASFIMLLYGIIYYVGHIAIYIIFRSLLLTIILVMTLALHTALFFRKATR